MAAELPPELLGQIFKLEFSRRGATDVEEIKNYSLVCSSWRFAAQHELFSTFVITSLNRPRPLDALPYSIIAKDKRHSHIGPAIHLLHINLRYPLAIPDVDPDFHVFLAHLEAVKILIFTADSAKLLFESENFTPSLRVALRHLLRLPSLTKLAVSTAGFPLALIHSCTNLQNLVLFSSTRDQGPLCDPWYDVREDEERNRLQVVPQIRVAELNLFGDPDYINGFTSWLRDSNHHMSTDRLARATVQFYRTIPPGPETIFCDFRNVAYLTIQFMFGSPTFRHQTQIDTSSLVLPRNDLKNLINLRSFKAEYPATGLEDIRKTVLILSVWVIPFLHSLPSPWLLKNLEIYLVTPSPWLRSTSSYCDSHHLHPGTIENFADVWEKLDAYVNLRFLNLEKFAVYMPWLTHEEVLEVLPKSRQKKIIRRAPFDDNVARGVTRMVYVG